MLEKMKEVVVDQLALDASKVVEDADFVKDFGADSLDLLQLMTALEDEFSVSIPDEEFENLRSVRDVLDLVERVSGKQ
ncbi:MAG: acyl carrier protein [Actinobacteria bacterium]|nr:acyl carrier protein [Actinomycetota bacterium]